MIRSDNVSVVFPRAAGALPALQEVSFQVERGEFVGVTGRVGSGKTTLLNVLAGLLTPTSGKVTVAGESVYDLNDRRRTQLRNRSIGIIFQTYHLHPMLTVKQNVMLPLTLGRPRPEHPGTDDAHADFDDMVRRLEISELADRRAGLLSSGQKQRVVIARALVGRPQVVLADEPTANLDESSAAVVLDVLKGMNHTAGATVLLVAHDPAAIAGVGRSLKLANGRLIE